MGPLATLLLVSGLLAPGLPTLDASPAAAAELMHDAGISPRRTIMAAHLQPAYAGHPHGDLPVTERVTHNSLILPMFHDMSEEQQDRVVAVVRRAAGMAP